MVKTEPMPLTKEEKDAILEQARLYDDFDYLLYKVLSTTGRRIGELYGVEDTKEIRRKKVGEKTIYQDGKPMIVDKRVPIYKKMGKWRFGVKVKDIDFDKKTMFIWVLKRRKPMQDETVLTPEVTKLLRVFIKKNRLGLEDYVFRRPGRSYRNLNNVLKKYAKEAGVPTKRVTGNSKTSLSVHSFRHYFITELKRKGWTDDRIMILTGHKTAAVLKTYSHVVPYDIRDEMMEAVRDI